MQLPELIPIQQLTVVIHEFVVSFSRTIFLYIDLFQDFDELFPFRSFLCKFAFELRGEGLVWLIGAVVCLLVANRRSSCSLTWAMDGIISSCQSAATFVIEAPDLDGRLWCMDPFWLCGLSGKTRL